ncbi:MAG TPA: hypothetical protein VMT89_06675, partial [Candidatus Acidoferrales bacterium]|nr:hypothetical protein [Candidatus Acidoferrales bacterium]
MSCSDVDAAQPMKLTDCRQGSGHLGQWVVDAAGLPAYDFDVEQRCDPVAQAYSPRPRPLRDPIHLIGNGRGLVAMAHASGGVEIYTQDRGHKWINRIDTWADPVHPEFPPQLGGGFSYYSVQKPGQAARVGSTRFEDLPVNHALQKQTRRFGVGYYETVTREDDIVVHRRVFAPDHEARALVAEVVVENPTATTQRYGVAEFWDVNLHEVSLELLTSDLSIPGITDQIERRRRDLASQFTQQVTWNADERVALVTTRAKSPPTGVIDRNSVARVDYFPDPIYLAVLDGAQPDAVWLSDSELWPDQQRTPPAAVGLPGSAASRRLDIDGAGQHAVLAIRVPIEVKPHQSTTLRFAFGYVPGGGSPDTAVAALRNDAERLQSTTLASWRDRLVWAAFPGLSDAAVVQRELAWASYNAIANTTYDEYRGVRLLGQGGSYKYIHGLDGAMGDLALFAEAMILVDPQIARDTLAYALATQIGGSQHTPWRFPYATTGVGAYSDVGIYDQRSDAYYFLPSAIGRYTALSRDLDFLTQPVAYYPRAASESGTVLDHIGHALDYGTETLGFGARGLVAIGTGDYADGIDSLATEPATRTGTSSTYNAGALIYGFPLAADIVEPFDAALAERLRTLAQSQGQALLERAWEGNYFYRGFVDSG